MISTGTYKGYEGDYMLDNIPPADYLQIGMDSAAKIRPLNSEGKPIRGKIGLLTVGFSNTTMESQQFIKVSNADPQKIPNVYVVDGAVVEGTLLNFQIRK